MNDKEMSESSGNEADVSEMGEESIDERNKLHTSEEARKPYTLTLAPETVHLVWKYSKVPVCGMLEHWSDVVSFRNQVPLADRR